MRKTLGFALFLTITLVLMSFGKIYGAVSSSGADLLWNSDEAYLFVGVQEKGYRHTYATYLLELGKEAIGGRLVGLGEPSDTRHNTVIFRITPTAVERFTQQISVDEFVPAQGAIYANNDGRAWKWTGSGFQPANTDEQHQYTVLQATFPPGFQNVNGWSEQYGILNRRAGEEQFRLTLSGRHIVIVARISERKTDISIDVLRSDSSREVLWRSSEKPHVVSRTEYERVFGARTQ